jgi:predicted RNA-binding protein
VVKVASITVTGSDENFVKGDAIKIKDLIDFRSEIKQGLQIKRINIENQEVKVEVTKI